MNFFNTQDPFELNRNVSGGFGESGFKRFMHYCKKAEEILDDLTDKNEEAKDDERKLAGILRLFEIPAPPTPKETRKERRGTYREVQQDFTHEIEVQGNPLPSVLSFADLKAKVVF